MAGTAQYLCQQSITGSTGRVSQADTRSKVAISRRGERSRHSRVGGIEDAGRSSRKNDGLLARLEGRDLVVLLIPGLDPIPAQTIIQREAAPETPAILTVDANVFIPAVKGLKLALVVLAGNA